jgi:hypothetical protein
MFESRGCVLLSVVMLAEIVVMGSLMMMTGSRAGANASTHRCRAELRLRLRRQAPTSPRLHLAIAVELSDLAFEPLAPAVKRSNVVVSERAPFFLDLADGELAITFDTVPSHVTLLSGWFASCHWGTVFL